MKYEKLNGYDKKVIGIEDIEKIYKTNGYEELCRVVADLISDERLLPVKNSGGNGKKPTLLKKYRILDEKIDNSDLILYHLNSKAVLNI